MSKIKEGGKHILFIDGLRASAALYVLVCHSIIQNYDSESIKRLSKVNGVVFGIMSQGRLAVNLFIVISGYSLMLSVIKTKYKLKNGNAIFFKRRSIRILPPYFFALFISLVFIHFTIVGQKTGTHWDECIPVTTADIVTHVLMIHDFFVSHTSKINDALWSISVEWRIYLLFPFLLLCWRKLGPWFTLAIGLAVVSLMFILLTYLKTFYPDIDNAGRGLNPYLVLFILGMFAADITFSDSIMSARLRKIPWNVLLPVSIILFVTFRQYIKTAGYSQDILPERVLDILFGVCCFCLLLVCSEINQKGFKLSLIPQIFSWKPLVFIGTFSYSIYLIHPPLLQLIQQYLLFPFGLSDYASTCILATGGVISIIGIAYIFFLLCERPFLNILKFKKTTIAELEVVSPAP